MAKTIKCPTCGEKTSADLEFCQYCQSRLQPLTGNLKGADTPLTPGQIPTKKSTADLEPILPQWLRDARGAARDSTEDDFLQTKAENHPPAPPSRAASFSSQDLLAGLQSQSENDDEDETPDWLANITGGAPTSGQSQGASSDEMRWVDLGGAKDSSQAKPAEADAPSWLSDLTTFESQPAQNDGNAFAAPASSFSSSDAPDDWMRQSSADAGAQNDGALFGDSDNAFAPAASSDDTPDWMRQMSADADAPNDGALRKADGADTFAAPAASSDDTPDWMRQMSADAGVQNDDAFAAPAASSDDTPDWMRQMSADAGAPNDNAFNVAPAMSDASDTPDWLGGLGSDTPVAAPAASDDWMKDLQVGGSEPSMQGDAFLPEAETPSWLSDAPIPTSPASAQSSDWQSDLPPAQDDAALGDVPSWLKAAAPQSSIYAEETPQSQPPPTFFKDEPVSSTSPAFAPDSQVGVDALFTDMPDWLSSSADASSPSAPSSSPASSPAISDAALASGELPSWVQAMRPVDAGVSQVSSSVGDQALEARGALAGLQGVLAAAPNYAPTSKPKAYSIKLNASAEQLSQAALLEQILAAETAPVSIASFSALKTSRPLRWLIAFIFFSAVFATLYLRTQIFSLPVNIPLEVGGALQVAQSIPEDAPVLVAFDYEPARVGEMEAAAAPLFDQMVLLRHPRLTFISTNENGAILAERFMITGPLAGHWKNGLQYTNLGYLAGGQMGIRAFAQDPQIIARFDISFAPAWESAQLQGVASFSQFAAFIIVTDNADSARAWIEQTASARGSLPIVVVASAQAAPMIQPYYASQQINGLIGGLYGGAVFEQSNANRPGTARAYWDAYSIGMWLAMASILIGGSWNLVLGMRDRAADRETK